MTLVREPLDSRILRLEALWAVRGWIRGEDWGKQETIYWLENILFFIPFGFSFPWHKKSWVVIVVAAAFSAIIELSQYIFILGECELDDVITNTIGAIIGFWFYKLLEWCINKWRKRYL